MDGNAQGECDYREEKSEDKPDRRRHIVKCIEESEAGVCNPVYVVNNNVGQMG